MKTMLLIAAAAFLVAAAWSATALRADDKPADDKSADSKSADSKSDENKSDAEQAAATAGKPASCVPAVKDPQRHEQFMKDKEAALEKGPIRLVFVGDSITDAWRGGEQNSIYEERWGKYNPLNLGISGDKTEHVLWRLEHGELDGLEHGAKLVVMMIGT